MSTDTVTRDDVRELQSEAGAAGDLELSEACLAALDGDEEAWDACVDVIRLARAMGDEAQS